MNGRGPPRGGPGRRVRKAEEKAPRSPPAPARGYVRHAFPHTWRSPYGVLTENSVPGTKVYGERLFMHEGKELRTWNPRRSKLGAIAILGSNALKFEGNETILYLGAASGTTVSHLSDIVAGGSVVAVEKSIRSFRDLLNVARMRRNIHPVLSDARETDTLVPIIPGGADMVYQDVAQRDQAQIFLDACDRFLKPGGLGVLMVKARSITVSRDTKEVFDEVEGQLRDSGLKVWERKNLEPFEADHVAMVVNRP
ncbi:MAG: fibrillarin-like rRNA/tRNA 2'-O-methyltransferase [Euryarchaeota archaeon]|nr:fibrillarin-like rRNA/tRNA 2'-O-methyltransferase [Euryarchaeota archaeon]